MIDVVPPEIPCMIPGSQSQYFGSDFMIRVAFFPFLTSGHQALFTKRHPQSQGNRPGVVLWLIGSSLELWTFGDGDDAWSIARTGRRCILPGESYEVLAVRFGNKARLIVNGLDRTHPQYQAASPGDVNCSAYAFIGAHIYDSNVHNVFEGRIKSLAVYDNAVYRPEWVGRRSDWKDKREPKTRIPLGQLLQQR